MWDFVPLTQIWLYSCVCFAITSRFREKNERVLRKRKMWFMTGFVLITVHLKQKRDIYLRKKLRLPLLDTRYSEYEIKFALPLVRWISVVTRTNLYLTVFYKANRMI